MMPEIRRKIGGVLRTARGRLQPHPIVLCYHRVADLEHDPQLLAVRPDRFDRHMEVLRRVAVPVPLREFVPGRSHRAPAGRSVVVTFDDGYSDNLEIAKPILERHEVPATVFVVAGMVGSAEEFWWDELERLLLRTPPPAEPLELELGGRMMQWSSRPDRSDTFGPGNSDSWTILEQHDPTPMHGLYRELATRFRTMAPHDQRAALAVLRSWVGRGGEGRSTHLVLDPDRLCRLADDGLVTVGSHGLWHRSFAGFSREDRLHEMSASRVRLECIVSRTVDEFAYPFGAPVDLPTDYSADLQAAGYRLACANFEGTVRARADRFRLPRFLVRDWTGEEFASRLGRWFGHRVG